MSRPCDCKDKKAFDCGRSDDEHTIDDLQNDFLIILALLDRNTKQGYPMEADSGECYYCGQGLCEDEDGYQDDELMTPEHHKPECVWRQARETIAALTLLRGSGEKEKQ